MRKLTITSFFAFIISLASFAQPSDPGPDNCLEFDGSNDYINLGSPSQLLELSLGSFTLEAWIKTSGFGDQAIIGNFDGNPAYSMYLNSGFLAFHCGSDAYTSSVPLYDNEWHHIAVTRDFGNDLLIYYDGIEIYSLGSDPAGSFEAEHQTWIGRSPDNFEQYIGNIDEVRVWSTSRTEAQIREYMFNVLEGNEANLVAYYRFDETSGTVLPDQTANGLDGTLTNMDDADWVASNPFNTWLGGTSNDWTNTANWSLGTVPAGENVGIFDFATGNDPAISSSISVDNMYIGSGVNLSISSGFTIPGNLLVENNLSLPSTGTSIIFDSNVEIASTASLTIEAGAELTVNGILYNQGSFTIESPTGMGATGSLITNGSLYNTGTMTAQRWISAGDTSSSAVDDYNWHSMSIPTANTTAGSLFPWDRVIVYNENDNSWSNLEYFSDVIERGSGYLVKTPDAKTIGFTGTFNDGDYSFSLTNTGADASHGYELVGNPYPSAIDLEEISLTNTGSTVWVYDPTTENYLTHSIGAGASTLGQYIQPFQAFFVKVSAGSSSGSIGFENADRVHNTGGTYYKSASARMEELVLKATGNDKYDVLYLKNRIAENDAYKFFSWNPAVPMIYSVENETNYAIFNLNELSDNKSVQLGFSCELSGNYSIEVVDEYFSEYDLYLLDNVEESSTLLEAGTSYDFYYEAGIDNNRFEVLFSEKSSLGMDDQQEELFTIFAADMSVNIWKISTDISGVEIYDMNGRLVSRKSSSSDRINIPLATKGIYIVKVISGNNTEVKKLGVF